MIVLIKVMNVFSGITRTEFRESTDAELALMPDSGYDFQGVEHRIYVLPINHTLTRQEALDIATEWAKNPVLGIARTNFQDYSKLQASLQGGLKRQQQYNRRRWQNKGKKQRDRHPQDLSSESD